MDEQVFEPENDSSIEITEKEVVKEEVMPKRAIETPLNDATPAKEVAKEVAKEAVVETPIAKQSNESSIQTRTEKSRVATGIKGFDNLIEGGFEKDSTVLLVGSAGTGKTLFSMQFLYEGATKFDEKCVFISFEEEKSSLYKHALQFGWDFEKLERENKFKLLFFKPHQVTKILEEGGGQIREALMEIGAKRVVVDSITSYALLFTDEYKRREKVLEFFNLLEKWGVTSIVIAENSPQVIEKEEGSLGFISDAVISMYYQHDEEKGIRIHSLEILKMRGTRHTNKLCAFNFEEEGIVVYPDVEVF
ncbi:MAG: AAA family ATPase [Candidatus Diapherotrites archaeon]|nr:AAA family ATPase [Candidatus Diapherotrites archaeon]